jgi:hypothetical protein
MLDPGNNPASRRTPRPCPWGFLFENTGAESISALGITATPRPRPWGFFFVRPALLNVSTKAFWMARPRRAALRSIPPLQSGHDRALALDGAVHARKLPRVRIGTRHPSLQQPRSAGGNDSSLRLAVRSPHSPESPGTCPAARRVFFCLPRRYTSEA